MLAPGWSAARAGLAGLVLAALLARPAFGFAGAGPGLLASAPGVAAEGGFVAATILYVRADRSGTNGIGIARPFSVPTAWAAQGRMRGPRRPAARV